MKRFRLLCLLLLSLTSTLLRATWTPETLPMVHLADARRYVCNPDGLMSAAAVDSTDAVLHRLEREKGIESLVVIVRQIEGGDPYEFGMALARKYHRRPDRWDDVSAFVRRLSEPKYYRDPVVKYGYMIGRETAGYVSSVMDRWRFYGKSHMAVRERSNRKRGRYQRPEGEVKIYRPGDPELSGMPES